MKRGFLNSSKAKKRTAAAVDEESTQNPSSKKGGAGLVQERTGDAVRPVSDTITSDGIDDLPPLDCEPDELDLHTTPPEMLSALDHRKGRTRAVFRRWPRDPNGKNIVYPYKTKNGCKVAGNGIHLWGATLYDFYRVQRIAACENYVTSTTGRRLAASMREIGELDTAAPEIAWAGEEEHPREVPPCDVGQLVEDADLMIGFGVAKSIGLVKKQKSSKAIIEPFDFDNYPDPWPLVPFSQQGVVLQKPIPLHLLPRKLVVHDPWNLLSVSSTADRDDIDVPWTKKTDITHTYSLHLSEVGEKRVEEEMKGLAEEQVRRNSRRECYTIFPWVESSGPIKEPPVVAVPPPEPAPPESTPVAHVYMSPTEKLGNGNHSEVYKVEWELPRSLLVSPRLCETCVVNMARREMGKKESERNLRPVGANPSNDRASIQGGDVTVTDIKNPHTTAEFVRDAGKGTKVELVNLQDTGVSMRVDIEGLGDKCEEKGDSMVLDPDNECKGGGTTATKNTAEAGNSSSNGKKPEESSSVKVYTVRDPPTTRIITYDGPVLEYHPDVQWQLPGHPPVCEHMAMRDIRSKNPPPPTARVEVAAKLSHQGDLHLAQEATNYQIFPSHFFEHWNGYNMLPPLHDPVPVNALVPQFYGYYVPDPVEATDEGSSSDNYLSPIMLLEHCGTPVVPEKMSLDDRNECGSLLLRFHEAQWLHGSFAPRNLLSQQGHPSEWPLGRMLSQKRSFRLIDFGRSKKMRGRHEAADEECQALRVFYLTHNEGLHPYPDNWNKVEAEGMGEIGEII